MTEANTTERALPARKNKNRAANRAAIQLLAETYPAAFGGDPVRPLKIGIQEDLLADGKVPASKIKRALASWVRSPLYHKSMQEGADRVDLQGNPAGTVTAEEAAHAKAMLKKLRDARREREKQAREAERRARAAEREARLNAKLAQLVNKPANR